MRGIHRYPVNSPQGHWRGAFMFSLICAWINRWVNNREAGDFRRYRPHFDVILMHLFTQGLNTKKLHQWWQFDVTWCHHGCQLHFMKCTIITLQKGMNYKVLQVTLPTRQTLIIHSFCRLNETIFVQPWLLWSLYPRGMYIYNLKNYPPQDVRVKFPSIAVIPTRHNKTTRQH